MKNQLIILFSSSLLFGFSASATSYNEEEARDEEALELVEGAQDPFFLDTIQSIADAEKKVVEFGKKAIEFGKKAVTVGKEVYEVGKKAVSFIEVLGEKAHKALNAIGITDEVLKAMPQKIIQQGSKAIEAYAREKGMI